MTDLKDQKREITHKHFRRIKGELTDQRDFIEEIIRQEILKTSKAFLYHGATYISDVVFQPHQAFSIRIPLWAVLDATRRGRVRHYPALLPQIHLSSSSLCFSTRSCVGGRKRWEACRLSARHDATRCTEGINTSKRNRAVREG